MSRRSSDISGFVNFPINDESYQNTMEGGMFVRLVVIDTPRAKKYDDKWTQCCGGEQSFVYDECYHGDDQGTPEEDHFPYINTEENLPETLTEDAMDARQFRKYSSRSYLAILTIGSTGWSGYSQFQGAYWRCTCDDLTKEGRALYHLLEKLYPKCKICLQTWLDT